MSTQADRERNRRDYDLRKSALGRLIKSVDLIATARAELVASAYPQAQDIKNHGVMVERDINDLRNSVDRLALIVARDERTTAKPVKPDPMSALELPLLPVADKCAGYVKGSGRGCDDCAQQETCSAMSTSPGSRLR